MTDCVDCGMCGWLKQRAAAVTVWRVWARRGWGAGPWNKSIPNGRETDGREKAAWQPSAILHRLILCCAPVYVFLRLQFRIAFYTVLFTAAVYSSFLLAFWSALTFANPLRAPATLHKCKCCCCCCFFWNLYMYINNCLIKTWNIPPNFFTASVFSTTAFTTPTSCFLCVATMLFISFTTFLTN